MRHGERSSKCNEGRMRLTSARKLSFLFLHTRDENVERKKIFTFEKRVIIYTIYNED